MLPERNGQADENRDQKLSLSQQLIPVPDSRRVTDLNMYEAVIKDGFKVFVL